MNALKKYWKYLLLFIMGIFLGLMINIPSCSKQKPIVKIEYVKGEEIHDTCYIKIPKVAYLEIPVTEEQVLSYIESHPEKFEIPDSIPADSIDADSLLRWDYFAERTYVNTLFDNDSLGFCETECVVSENELKNLCYRYIPIQKTTTVIIPEEKKRITPFIEAEAGPIINSNFKGINGAGIGVGAGMIFRSGWGVKANYELDVLTSGIEHEIKAGIIKQF